MVERVNPWEDANDDTVYHLLNPDPLSVLSTARQVLLEGEHVWINPAQVTQLAAQWIQDAHERNSETLTAPWYDRYHFHDGTEKTVNWLLLLDALNFCFWAEPGQERWKIDYEGQLLDGYWAEAASLTRAIEEGIPLWDAKYLSTISEEVMASIFRGTGTIPLFAERVANAREVGRVLVEHFHGQFAYAIERAGYDAIKLVHLLKDYFSSFRDQASYRQQQIFFFKRAQICVADLAGSFKGEKWGRLTHLEQLTAFADYKLPQVLRHHALLEYEPSLAKRIERQELLASGSEEEIEIRAATIWACELLRQEMQTQGHELHALEIDQLLWLAGQNSAHMRPYHRTRTIYY